MSCFDGPTLMSRYILTCLCSPPHPGAFVDRQIWWSAASCELNVNVPVCGPFVLTTVDAVLRSSTFTLMFRPGSASHEFLPSSQISAPYLPAMVSSLDLSDQRSWRNDSAGQGAGSERTDEGPIRSRKHFHIKHRRTSTFGDTYPPRQCHSAAPRRSTASRSSRSRSARPVRQLPHHFPQLILLRRPMLRDITHLRHPQDLSPQKQCRELHAFVFV